MNVKITEKTLRQILTGAIGEVIDPQQQFKKSDCEKSVAIANKVIETLKELGISEEPKVYVVGQTPTA